LAKALGNALGGGFAGDLLVEVLPEVAKDGWAWWNREKDEKGCLDMAGNVVEWTSSLWGKDLNKPAFGYPYQATDGRESTAGDDYTIRITRGGSWATGTSWVRAAARCRNNRYDRGDSLGFRVVGASHGFHAVWIPEPNGHKFCIGYGLCSAV